MVTPLVSVGIPAYNGERFLCQSLESLLAQDHGTMEFIVSDNCSTDATGEICGTYAARDRRIKYSRVDRHLDAASNFDRVLQMATGDYFMWAAVDDLWEPAFVSTLLGLLIRRSEAVTAFSLFNTVDEHGREIEVFPHAQELPSPDRYQRLRKYLLQDEARGKANLIYGLSRRRVVQAAGGFRRWGATLWGADMMVVFRLLSFGDLALSGDLLFHKRQDADARDVGRDALGAVCMSSRYWRDMRNWYGYLAGYARLIGHDEHLTAAQKIQLRALLVQRTIAVGQRQWRRRLRPPSAWPA